MTNPFRWEHFIYILAGLALGTMFGYLGGIFAFSLLVSSASYSANATQASFFIYRFSSIPMQVTLIGMFLGAVAGFVYSHEKYEKKEEENKASQPQVIIVPQGQVPQQVVVPQQQQK